MNELTVTINGEPRRVPGPATARSLLEHLGLDPRGVVVELNEEIVRRPRLSETVIDDGDRIEVVHFVGGG
jgi:thiamine biosynthesis protein ThiS